MLRNSFDVIIGDDTSSHTNCGQSVMEVGQSSLKWWDWIKKRMKRKENSRQRSTGILTINSGASAEGIN